MSAARAWFAMVAALLAGCAGGPSGVAFEMTAATVDVPDGQLGPWVVWAHGRETREQVFGPRDTTRRTCATAFDHDIDPVGRTLVYENASYSFDPTSIASVLVVDHFDAWTSCAIHYALVPDPGDGALVRLGRGGNVTVAVAGDGTLVVDGHEAALDEAIRATYEARVKQDGRTYDHAGRGTFENLGRWPSDAFVPR